MQLMGMCKEKRRTYKHREQIHTQHISHRHGLPRTLKALIKLSIKVRGIILMDQLLTYPLVTTQVRRRRPRPSRVTSITQTDHRAQTRATNRWISRSCYSVTVLHPIQPCSTCQAGSLRSAASARTDS